MSVMIVIKTTTFSQVSPLISTKWNQGCNYNASCPSVGSGGACGKAYTGCNATGWAQILKYYQFPTTGMGYHCNTVPSYTSHCMDFSMQTYNYSVMPNVVSSANAEVAKLMYHLGIALDMNWSGTNSTSSFSDIPLKKYFKYSPRMYSMNYLISSYSVILDSIKSELNKGRPVFVKSNTLNHFYIIDGYNASNQVHCNFGWGGTYDGYYTINNVNTPAGNATPHIFLLNIRPMAGDLETAKDTIYMPASSGSNSIEFTSLSSWTMSTSSSWITLNITNGSMGYFDLLSGTSFSVTTNNGPIRYGYIYIQNATDIDTIVVKQDAGPLKVSPDTLYFTSAGGTQTVSLNYLSYGTWNSSTSDTWITYSPSTATGNATINVTVSNNTSSNRIGYIHFFAGQYHDTLFISQQGVVTNINQLNYSETKISIQNPVVNEMYINVNKNTTLLLYDINGRLLKELILVQGENKIKLDIEPGMYLIRNSDNTIHKKVIFLQN